MGALISLIILAVAIWAIVDCVTSSLEKGKKILWIVLIVLIPLIGAILYFLVGKKQ